jgi:phage terminase Nu1 subunit (DNA packaging protein)
MADQIVTAPVMAAIVGLTQQRLGQYAAAGMPKAGRDSYPLAGTVQWIIEYWKKRVVITPLSDARRRKLDADAGAAELDLALKRGNVVDTRTLARAHHVVCSRIRSRLQAVPSKAAARVYRLKTVAEVEAGLREEIDASLEELSNMAIGRDRAGVTPAHNFG